MVGDMTDLRKYAKGKPCMIRAPGCSYNDEETVLCHWRDSSTGAGQKEADLIGAWGCRHCHDLVDDRLRNNGYNYEQVRTWHLDGIIRTQQQLIRDGIIKW